MAQSSNLVAQLRAKRHFCPEGFSLSPPLFVGLRRLLNGRIHGFLLHRQAPMELLVDVVISSLLVP